MLYKSKCFFYLRYYITFSSFLLRLNWGHLIGFGQLEVRAPAMPSQAQWRKSSLALTICSAMMALHLGAPQELSHTKLLNSDLRMWKPVFNGFGFHGISIFGTPRLDMADWVAMTCHKTHTRVCFLHGVWNKLVITCFIPSLNIRTWWTSMSLQVNGLYKNRLVLSSKYQIIYSANTSVVAPSKVLSFHEFSWPLELGTVLRSAWLAVVLTSTGLKAWHPRKRKQKGIILCVLYRIIYLMKISPLLYYKNWKGSQGHFILLRQFFDMASRREKNDIATPSWPQLIVGWNIKLAPLCCWGVVLRKQCWVSSERKPMD